MNLKMIVMASVAALMLGACAHKTHSHEDCACGHKEAKKECASGECGVEKKKGHCPDCEKADSAAAK